MNVRLMFSTVVCLTLFVPARAEVRLPAIFSEHMVLQRGVPVPVWGWADPGEEVTVTADRQTRRTQAGTDGKWMVRLAALKGGKLPRFVVQGKNRLTVEDVLVGEVWLCSGQSNMVMQVNMARNFDAERVAANFPEIRTFVVEPNYAKEPQSEMKGSWIVASPETVGAFSAAAYFFGRELHQKLRVPVGLLNASVGGTAIEAWISENAQRKSTELKADLEMLDQSNAAFDMPAAKAQYQKALAQWKAASRSGKRGPRRAPLDPAELQQRQYGIGVLFNGMIAPLVPYALRGAIWYQGEANTKPERAPYYRQQLSLLVEDWRARWGQGGFPFAWVQLPNFNGVGRNWPLVREGMLKALQVPHTGMAVTIDVGESTNIHPKNKQETGRRLAMWALGDVYKRKGVTCGPLPAGQKIQDGRIIVSFTHTGSGLVAKGASLQGFVIAGPDKKWVPAEAKISGKTVVLFSPEVSKPIAVRYAWSNNPQCNLYNRAGLPASPFRTDDWPEP